MLTIDAQVHAYERNHPGRPWAATLAGPPEVTGRDMVAAMDAVDVAGAILVSPYSLYRYDASYALQVRSEFPERFALVKPVDPADPAAAETVAGWAAIEGAVAVRLMLPALPDDPADPGINRVLAAAAHHDLPVNLLCPWRLEQVGGLAQRNASTMLVIDHLGLHQPMEHPVPARPFADLDRLLALAAFDNIVVKISGAGTLSHRPFPFDDLWDPVGRIIDAFGIDRCLWGTDWTRAVAFLSYREGVEAFRSNDRFSQSERAALMGGTLQRVYNWSPGQGGNNAR